MLTSVRDGILAEPKPQDLSYFLFLLSQPSDWWKMTVNSGSQFPVGFTKLSVLLVPTQAGFPMTRMVLQEQGSWGKECAHGVLKDKRKAGEIQSPSSL